MTDTLHFNRHTCGSNMLKAIPSYGRKEAKNTRLLTFSARFSLPLFRSLLSRHNNHQEQEEETERKKYQLRGPILAD